MKAETVDYVTTADGVRVKAGGSVWLAFHSLPERRVLAIPGFAAPVVTGSPHVKTYSSREAARRARLAYLRQTRDACEAEIKELESPQAAPTLPAPGAIWSSMVCVGDTPGGAIAAFCRSYWQEPRQPQDIRDSPVRGEPGAVSVFFRVVGGQGRYRLTRRDGFWQVERAL